MTEPEPAYTLRRDYRHREHDCGRLLFRGALQPGTHIQIRCPKCGRMHVVDVPLLSTGHVNGTG